MHKELIERLRTLQSALEECRKYNSIVSKSLDSLERERDTLRAELQNSITRRQEQMAAADFAVASLKTERDEYQKAADAMAWSHKVERDTLRQQLAEAQAAIEASRKQEPVGYVVCDDHASHPNVGTIAQLEKSLLSGKQLYAAPVVADEVPTEVTEVARVAIETVLREYNYPANPSNAARAGWRACRLHIAAMKCAA